MINHLWLGRIQGPTYYKPLLLAALLFPPALFLLDFGDSSLPRVACDTDRHLKRKPSSVFYLSYNSSYDPLQLLNLLIMENTCLKLVLKHSLTVETNISKESESVSLARSLSAPTGGPAAAAAPGSASRMREALVKVASFYASPSVSFVLDLATYVLFLLLISFTAIVGFRPSEVEGGEVLLCVWVGAYVVEELRQVCVCVCVF